MYEFGMPAGEINSILEAARLVFQFSSSQFVYSIPNHQCPGGTGVSGVRNAIDTRSLQVGDGSQRNRYSVTEGGHPRRFWSQENFSVSLQFKAAPVVAANRRIQALLYGTRYIK